MNMGKAKKLLADDTIIVFGKIPVGEYRKFFMQALGDEYDNHFTTGGDFQNWLLGTQGGRTLNEALDEIKNPLGVRSMPELLAERRCSSISDANKEFIIAFNSAITELGYDFGDAIRAGHSWGSQLMIVYGKTDTKSRPCPARIHIRENDILFQIYFTNIDAHRQYIEAAPAYIKEVFTHYGDKGCKSCRRKCGPKEYTIDGQFKSVCRDAPFWFDKPSVERLPDYIGLITEFYPVKARPA
jgi:hypothetical protein